MDNGESVKYLRIKLNDTQKVAYIVSHERGRGKVLVFAHNSHLQRGKAQWQFGMVSLPPLLGTPIFAIFRRGHRLKRYNDAETSHMARNIDHYQGGN